jgi:hypothetical protein
MRASTVRKQNLYPFSFSALQQEQFPVKSIEMELQGYGSVGSLRTI